MYGFVIVVVVIDDGFLGDGFECFLVLFIFL